MNIDKINPFASFKGGIQGIQPVVGGPQEGGKSAGVTSSSTPGLVERLNSMDNKLEGGYGGTQFVANGVAGKKFNSVC